MAANEKADGAIADPFGHAPISCENCGDELRKKYWRVDGDAYCGKCRGTLKAKATQQKPGSLMGAILLGLLPATAGAAIWAYLVYNRYFHPVPLVLAIGWAVGSMVHIGSRKFGGLRFQLAAALLTYLAVCASYVPTYLYPVHELPVMRELMGNEGARRVFVWGLEREVRPPHEQLLAAVPLPRDAPRLQEGQAYWVPEADAAKLKPLLQEYMRREPENQFSPSEVIGYSLLMPALLIEHNFLAPLMVVFGITWAVLINRRHQVVVKGPYRIRE